MRDDFIFIFDNIVRDLPSTALISYKLLEKGYQCRVIHLSELNNYLKHERPKVVVLNKPFLKNYDLLVKQLFGLKVCVLHTEGAMGARFLEKSKPKIDLYFFWNQMDKNLYKKRNNWDEIDHPVVGCQRTDFLFPPLLTETLSSNVATKCDNNQLVISLASPGGYSGLSDAYIDFKQKQLKDLSDKPINLKDFMSVEDRVADLAYKILKEIVASKLNIKLLFKPHPNESIEIWERKLAEFSSSKALTFVTDQSISEVLQLVDVHICAGHCQTLSEAIMMGVYSIGFNPIEANDLFDTKWMSIGMPHIRGEKDIIVRLKKLIEHKKSGQILNLTKSQQNENKPLINNFFEYCDGAVCQRCSDHLEELHKQHSDTLSLSGLKLSYVLSSSSSMFRRALGVKYRKYFNKNNKVSRHKRNWSYENDLLQLYEVFQRIYGLG